jgi:hypothetical protein
MNSTFIRTLVAQRLVHLPSHRAFPCSQPDQASGRQKSGVTARTVLDFAVRFLVIATSIAAPVRGRIAVTRSGSADT